MYLYIPQWARLVNITIIRRRVATKNEDLIVFKPTCYQQGLFVPHLVLVSPSILLSICLFVYLCTVMFLMDRRIVKPHHNTSWLPKNKVTVTFMKIVTADFQGQPCISASITLRPLNHHQWACLTSSYCIPAPKLFYSDILSRNGRYVLFKAQPYISASIKLRLLIFRKCLCLGSLNHLQQNKVKGAYFGEIASALINYTLCHIKWTLQTV